MKYSVDQILSTEPNAFQGLTKTTFMSGGKSIYIFTKVGNDISEGDTLDGDATPDKSGNLKFTKTKVEGFNREAYSGPRAGVPSSPAKSSDQRESIEKQSSLKAAIEIVRDATLNGTDVDEYAKLVVKTADYLYRNLENVGKLEVKDTVVKDIPENDDIMSALQRVMPGTEEV